MKVNLISIGNSKGIRIPASIIRECAFGDELEMRIENGTLVLAPAKTMRQGWDEAFKQMADRGDDEALISDAIENDFDDEQWLW